MVGELIVADTFKITLREALKLCTDVSVVDGVNGGKVATGFQDIADYEKDELHLTFYYPDMGEHCEGYDLGQFFNLEQVIDVNYSTGGAKVACTDGSFMEMIFQKKVPINNPNIRFGLSPKENRDWQSLYPDIIQDTA